MSWWHDELNLPEEGSSLAHGIDLLHASIIATTLCGALVIGLLTLYFTWRYRRNGAARLPTPQVTMPLVYEWGLIGGLTSLFVIWWVIGYRQFLQLQTVPTKGLDIFVTAKQWMYQFAYDDGRASIAVLVVPAEHPVRLIMTSRDVIHGFSIPDFRLKHDIMPGCTTLTWFNAHSGIHPILCTQYCGLDHALMQGAVVALDSADYARWHQGETPLLLQQALEQLRPQQPQAAVGNLESTEDLPSRGLAVAARRGCLACHTTDGQRHVGPTWKGLFGKQVVLQDGRTVIADESYLTESMMDPGDKVVFGYANVMPSYIGLLEPSESAALVALIISLGGDQAAPQRLPRLPRTTTNSDPLQSPEPPTRQ